MPSMTFTVNGVEHRVFGNRDEINGVKALVAERDALAASATDPKPQATKKGLSRANRRESQGVSGEVPATAEDATLGLSGSDRAPDGPQGSDS